MADILPRKFYRLTGLHNVFKATNNIYNTASLQLASQFSGKINEHTILFLTADTQDAGKKVVANNHNGTEDVLLYESFTMIWARGAIYAVDKKTVKEVTYDKTSLAFTISYTDGSSRKITTTAMGFTAGDNIDIDDDNVISALGYLFDDKNNFIINPDENYANGQSNAVITGVYPNVGDKNLLLVTGCGTSNAVRKNAFSVDNKGTAKVKTDVVLDTGQKLSEIHNVVDSDWAFIG